MSAPVYYDDDDDLGIEVPGRAPRSSETAGGRRSAFGEASSGGVTYYDSAAVGDLGLADPGGSRQGQRGPDRGYVRDWVRGFYSPGFAKLGALIDLPARAAVKAWSATTGQQVDLPPLAEPALDRLGRAYAEILLGEGAAEEQPEHELVGRIASAVPTGVATLPLGGAMGLTGAGRVGLEAASIGLGETAAYGAEKAGLGPVGQAVAGIAGSITPGAAVRMAVPAARGARAAARNVTEQGRIRSGEESARAILGEEIARRDEAAEVLTRAAHERKFGTRPTTAAVLEETEPGVRNLEVMLAREYRPFAREVAVRRRENLEHMRAAYDEMFAPGGGERVRQQFHDNLARMKSEVDEAYLARRNVREVPTNMIRATAKQLRAAQTEERLLPAYAVRRAEALGERASLIQIENYRRLLTDQIAAAKRQGMASRAYYLGQLRQSVDATMRELAEAGGYAGKNAEALQRAIALRAEQGRLFEWERNLFDAFTEIESLDDAMARILRSHRPAETMRRLRAALERTPDAEAAQGAIEGLTDLMYRQILGEGFESIGTKRAYDRLRRLGPALDVVAGDGAADRTRKFLESLDQVRSGKAGTLGATYGTGSGVESLETVEEMAYATREALRGRLTHVVDRMFQRVFKRLSSRAERNAYLSRLMLDPEAAAEVLRQMEARAPVAWESGVLARSVAPGVGRGIGSATEPRGE